MRPERALEKTVSYSEDRKGWRGKDAGLGSCSHGDLPYKRWERGFLSPKGGGPRFLADEGLENFLKGERGGHSLRSSTEAQTTQHETKLLTNRSERRGRTQEGQRAPCWCRDSHIKFAPERPEPPREGGSRATREGQMEFSQPVKAEREFWTFSRYMWKRKLGTLRPFGESGLKVAFGAVASRQKGKILRAESCA